MPAAASRRRSPSLAARAGARWPSASTTTRTRPGPPGCAMSASTCGAHGAPLRTAGWPATYRRRQQWRGRHACWRAIPSTRRRSARMSLRCWPAARPTRPAQLGIATRRVCTTIWASRPARRCRPCALGRRVASRRRRSMKASSAARPNCGASRRCSSRTTAGCCASSGRAASARRGWPSVRASSSRAALPTARLRCRWKTWPAAPALASAWLALWACRPAATRSGARWRRWPVGACCCCWTTPSRWPTPARAFRACSPRRRP